MEQLKSPQQFFNSMYDETVSGWPVVAVDLDGVLNVYRGWSGQVETFPPAPGVQEFLVELRKRFNTIVVFTATMPLAIAEEWLNETGVAQYVDFVTGWKVPAEVYIDDKCVCHAGDFTKTLADVDSFVPHWKRQEGRDDNGHV